MAAAAIRGALKVGNKVASTGATKRPKQMFFCDWYMKLVKPGKKVPLDTVVFRVSMEMTKFDIRNYLEKIYKVQVYKVNTAIILGKRKEFKFVRGVYDKKPDYKKAYVVLENENFQFPNFYTANKVKEDVEKHER